MFDKVSAENQHLKRFCQELMKFLATASLGGLITTISSIAPCLGQSLNPQELNPPLRPTAPAPSPGAAPSPSIIPPNLPVTPGPSLPGNIQVKEFRFVGATVFSNTDLQNVVVSYTGRPLSPDELNKALLDLSSYYQKVGYILAYTRINPDQNRGLAADNAVVTIEVIEGRITDLQFLEPARNQAFVRRQLTAAIGSPFNVRELERKLRQLSVNPLVTTISTTLEPGAIPGEAQLKIKLVGANPLSIELETNNFRSENVGPWERKVEISHKNLGGIGDFLTVNVRNTLGSNALQLSYLAPITPQGTTLSVGVTNARSVVIQEPFTPLDLTTEFQNVDLTVRHPLLQWANQTSVQEFGVGFRGTLQNSQTSLLNIDFPFSPGADENGLTQNRAVRLFADWRSQGAKQFLYFRNEVSFGLGGALGGTINSSSPDNRYISLQGQALYLRQLTERVQLLARGTYQLADRPLFPTEQIQISGGDTLRGSSQFRYEDSGITASIEMPVRIYSSNRYGSLSVIPYLDMGYGFSQNLDTPNSSNERHFLATSGLGLIYSVKNRFNFRLDFGSPVEKWQPDLKFSIRARLY
jgi:hemolysin activation/secretion protein